MASTARNLGEAHQLAAALDGIALDVVALLAAVSCALLAESLPVGMELVLRVLHILSCEAWHAPWAIGRPQQAVGLTATGVSKANPPRYDGASAVP